MMGIAQKVAREFAEGVRSRGQSYFAKGRVLITANRPGEITARVKGTVPYKVRLKMRGHRLLASCTCPYFAPTGVPCKHIWATVLATDARGLLPSAPVRPLELVPVIPGQKKQAAPPPEQRPAPYPHQTYLADEPPDLMPPSDPYAYTHDPLPPTAPTHDIGDYLPSGYLPSSGGGPTGPGRPKVPYNKKPRPHKDKPRPPYAKNHPPYGGPQFPGAGLGPGGGPAGTGYLPSGRPANKAVPGRGAKKVRGKIVSNGAVARVAKRPLYYIVDVSSTLNQNQLVVDLARRQQRPGQDRGPLRPWYHAPGTVGGRPDPEDLEPLAALELAQTISTSASASTTTPSPNGAGMDATSLGTYRYIVEPSRQVSVLEKIGRTGRARLRRAENEEEPPGLRWDDGPPWQFWIDIRPADSSGKRWLWRGSLRRGDQRLDLGEPLVLLPGLVILTNGKAARFDDAGIYLWMARLRHEKEMALSDLQQDTMLGRILGDSGVPPSQLVEGLKLDEVDLPPTPCLTVRTPRQNWGRDADNLIAELEFDYEGARVSAFPPGRVAVQTDRRRAIRRSERIESAAKAKLEELGFREIVKDFRYEPGTMEVSPKRMPQATRELVQAGWRVEAEGTLIRPAGDFKMNVTSGMDWFELDGHLDFGGQNVPLPEVLAAAGRGETMIRLSDGSMGLLPDEWLKKYGALAELGTTEGEAIRFGKDQAAVLDALVAAQADVRMDATFEEARRRLHSFEGVVALDAPAGFRGELRPYQRDGLGWLEYLTQFSLGGILADDMGLGKTIQVLALLQRRRSRRQMKGPSLIVVPRSLVFNWLQEAEKFTPRLRLLDYTGPGRHDDRAHFRDYDLIVTTYGVMRSDIAELAQIEFDYVILDEAQAIKNAESQSAKAARLLQGRHKLAMSGTPIENHLGELWSIVEFLNPGMLGSAGVFKRVVGGGSGSALDDDGKKLLSKALKPIILRRTKAQVVQDLPEKVEQTLYCDMEPAQRQIYEQIRAHYRAALLRKEAGSISTNKIEVLEALLRLRQAACHPGLIDEARKDDPSAKLDMLVPSVEEVIDEGHKVLVFSQFTSFLAIVRDRLDKAKIDYEYLDGRTRDRQSRVERFQNDPDTRVFLISLKAGGLGLNLTAAEYVYLLDPWWNPAVEAQAIDRSHRIGQTQNVFAYRLICRDTVEQKILELQQKKRDLADAILGADNQSVIKALTRDDLEFLLS